MSAALSSYLGRLVHPARKAYATAYAEHILTNSATPKVPTTLNADTAQKIRCKVERYAKTADTGEDIAGACDISEGLIHLPEAVRAYALEHGDSDLLSIVEGFVPSAATERMSDHYRPQQESTIVETVDVDCLDITDLEPSLARELALKLVRWNGRGKVYSRRNDRRYLHRDIRRIDLADATVQALPNYSDLVAGTNVHGTRPR